MLQKQLLLVQRHASGEVPLREQTAEESRVVGSHLGGFCSSASPQSMNERQGVFSFVEVFAETLLLGVLRGLWSVSIV
jgi:hypothetical protein